MPEQAADAVEVTLGQLLERREARVAERQRLLDGFGCPVVTLTVVSPGPVKRSAQTRFLFAEGSAAIGQVLAARGHAILAQSADAPVTGPEGTWVVDADAVELKRALVALEEGHPLGRLWDVDVARPDGSGVDRRSLGLPPRACLVCEAPAHACARSRTHGLEDLRRAIDARIDGHRRSCRGA
jgi:holo-ACP synthase